MLGVAWEIAVEVGREAAEEQVVVVAGDGGVVKVAERNTVRSVCSLRITGFGVPFIVTGVCTVEKCAVCEEGEVAGRLADDANLIAILEIAADSCSELLAQYTAGSRMSHTRKILDDRNIVSCQFFGRPNAAQLEELWTVEGTG
jgi:hypothetical protein